MKRMHYGPREFGAIEYTLSCNIKPGQNFIDLGAHIGQETIPVAKIVGTHGKVYAFEPQTEALSELEKNIKKAGLTNVLTFDCAIGNKKGNTTFYKYNQLEQLSTTCESSSNMYGGYDKKTTVLMDTLDNLFPVETIHCIKMDIQGGEPYALMGGKNLIERCRPSLVMEWERITDELTDWAFEYLTKLGYKFLDINGYYAHVNHPSEIYSSKIQRTNILCYQSKPVHNT